MTFWCHGTPGIALARLRAYEMTGDERYEADAIAALKTTQGSIESALDSWAGNFSLCHGLAGNAEVLIYSAEIRKYSDCVGGCENRGGALRGEQFAMDLWESHRRDPEPDVRHGWNWPLLFETLGAAYSQASLS